MSQDFEVERVYSDPTKSIGDYIQQVAGDIRDPARRVARLAGEVRQQANTMAKELRMVLRDECPDPLPPTTWQNEWPTSRQLTFLATRYHLWCALYLKGNHYRLLLKIPQKTREGNYRALVYDPFRSGEQTITIPQSHMRAGDQRGTIVVVLSDAILYGRNLENRSASRTENVTDQGDFVITHSASQYDSKEEAIMDNLHLLEEAVGGRYDLTIPHFEAWDDLYKAKNTLLQKDWYNCGLWCLIHAAIAYGVKEGENEFKTSGLWPLYRDTGIWIMTPEDRVSPRGSLSSPWLPSQNDLVINNIY